MRRRFRPGPAAVDGDDVAEFTLEGASAGELNRHRSVFVAMQQVEARHRAARHVGLVDNAVQRLCRPVFECGGDSRKGLFRLTYHDVIGHQKHGLGVCAGPGPTHEGAPAKGASAGEDGQCVGALRVHGAHHHQVGPLQILIPQLLEGVVDQPDLPGRRTKRGDGDQAQRRRHRALGNHLQHALKPPERRRKTRPHHQNFDIRSQGRQGSVGQFIGVRVQAWGRGLEETISMAARWAGRSVEDLALRAWRPFLMNRGPVAQLDPPLTRRLAAMPASTRLLVNHGEPLSFGRSGIESTPKPQACHLA